MTDAATPSATVALPALAARAQLGERAALESLLRALLRALQGPLLAHILGIVHDADSAADVLQDSLIVIARRLHTLTETRWVRAWAYRVATREAVRAAQRAHRDAFVSLSEVAELADPQPEELAMDPELSRELPALLAALPSAAQGVLRLHYLDALTLPEIAAALEIPLGTVKSRLAYGLSALRNSLRR